MKFRLFCASNQLKFKDMRREILFIGGIFLLFSCSSVEILDTQEGTLSLSIKSGEITKSVTREIPDTNIFILKVSRSSGGDIYKGPYGQRPAEMKLEAGTYDIEVKSLEFTIPEFDKPLYYDSKSVVVTAGTESKVSLLVKQINSGVRLQFSDRFKNEFSEYIAELKDSKGSAVYYYNETRFLYLNSGKISLYLVNSGDKSDSVDILSKSIAANTMLTINLDVANGGSSDVKSGITLDTNSNWSSMDYIYGIEKEGDGLTAESAYLVSQLSANTGKSGVWVTGYIVGGDLTQSGINFQTPFTSESNLALAASASERERAKCISVALASGSVRTALSLVANPANLGKRVWLKGTIVASYFNLTGINPVTEYKLE